MKALFVVNRRSGVKRRRDPLDLIREHCRLEFETFECELKDDLDSLVPRARTGGVDVVFAVGGDGTVHEVAKRLIGTTLIMGIVPAGSGNGLARHLGIPMKIRDALTACRDQKVAIIDTARVNGMPFIGTMGVGFDAWVAEAFASSGVRGLATYIRVGVGGFFKYEPEVYQLTIDGQPLQQRALLIAVANASQYGNNARIAPLASLQDGLLDVVLLDRPPLWRIPIAAARLFGGTIHRGSGVTMLRGRNIEIQRPSPGPAHLDGEPVSLPERLTIEIVPQSLRILLPDRATTI